MDKERNLLMIPTQEPTKFQKACGDVILGGTTLMYVGGLIVAGKVIWDLGKDYFESRKESKKEEDKEV